MNATIKSPALALSLLASLAIPAMGGTRATPAAIRLNILDAAEGPAIYENHLIQEP